MQLVRKGPFVADPEDDVSQIDRLGARSPARRAGPGDPSAFAACMSGTSKQSTSTAFVAWAHRKRPMTQPRSFS